MEVHQIPQFLNKPSMIFLWESDEVIMTLLILFFIRSTGSLYALPLLYLTWQYSQWKKYNNRGFVQHLLYMAGSKIKGYPSYLERRFYQ